MTRVWLFLHLLGFTVWIGGAVARLWTVIGALVVWAVPAAGAGPAG